MTLSSSENVDMDLKLYRITSVQNYEISVNPDLSIDKLIWD